MKPIVIDASVAVKWFLIDEELSAEAAQVLENGGLLFAPDLIQAELGNIFWKLYRKGKMPEFETLRALQIFGDMGVMIWYSANQLGFATRLSIEYGCSFYDGLYIALAIRHNTYCITADKKLFNLFKDTTYKNSVRFLGEL